MEEIEGKCASNLFKNLQVVRNPEYCDKITQGWKNSGIVEVYSGAASF
jgi:hypothetical protein